MKKRDKYIEYNNGKRVLLDEDDVPEAGAAFFKNTRPGPEVLAELMGEKAAKKFLAENQERIRKRGRPKLPQTKQEVKLRIDPDIVAAYKALGAGWQTRMNDALRGAIYGFVAP
ncbi:MAG: BrnA antitoxin family protein [Alphaproteobacteria bacterium]|nr:BrnA antitoxin family protein [Alphaproteobacteria bacterium]